jgi:hypothetical protein
MTLKALNIFSFTLSSFKLLPGMKEMIQRGHFFKEITSYFHDNAGSLCFRCSNFS